MATRTTEYVSSDLLQSQMILPKSQMIFPNNQIYSPKQPNHLLLTTVKDTDMVRFLDAPSYLTLARVNTNFFCALNQTKMIMKIPRYELFLNSMITLDPVKAKLSFKIIYMSSETGFYAPDKMSVPTHYFWVKDIQFSSPVNFISHVDSVVHAIRPRKFMIYLQDSNDEWQIFYEYADYEEERSSKRPKYPKEFPLFVIQEIE